MSDQIETPFILPSEMLSMIFSLLPSEAKRACSLVSRSWSLEAQQELFSGVCAVLPHKDNDVDSVSLRFLAFIADHRHLALRIRKLRLSGPLNWGRLVHISCACTLTVFQDILALLPNIEHLRLEGVVLRIDTKVVDRKFFDLKRLHIYIPYFVDEDPSVDLRDILTLLSPFRRLGKLHLDCQSGVHLQDELFHEQSLVQRLPQLKIDDIIVENFRDSLFLLYALNRGQTLSQLSSLTVFSFSNLWTNPLHMGVMKGFIREVGPHLKSLRCTIRDVFRVATEFLEIIAEPTWDQLEELIFDVETEIDILRMSCLPKLLPCFTCPQLKYLTFVIITLGDVTRLWQNLDLTRLEDILVSYRRSAKVRFVDHTQSGYNRLSDSMETLLPRLAEQNRLDFPITSISEWEYELPYSSGSH